MAQDEPTIETILTTDEEALDDLTHDNLEPIAKKYKGGRMKADVWSFFTETKNPQKLQSAPCKNCKAIVKYYSESER
uniref:BED-type domain-containing protein n=1 Tax=Romanomermis culicivorax TaxID=13658 RepID=A0A915HNR5_ROMCU